MGALAGGLIALLLLAALWAVLVAFAAIGLFTAWNVWRAWLLREALREKGYDWVKLADARQLALRADPALLRQLPDRDELASTPGYADGDAVALADFAISLGRLRDAGPDARRRRQRSDPYRRGRS